MKEAGEINRYRPQTTTITSRNEAVKQSI